MKLAAKRIFDIFTAFFGLVLLAPVLVIVAMKIRRELGAPVFFKQIRPGLDGKPFELVKFRSMAAPSVNSSSGIDDESRLSAFGLKLRASSLDELPELINVLKGDMSLVGPRPLLMEYLPLYSRTQNRRHEVRPGITGWAQVNGRNAISWEQKFEHDVWYVDNQSFFLDIKIIFMTLLKVVKRDDIAEEGHVTMSKFEGTAISNSAQGSEE